LIAYNPDNEEIVGYAAIQFDWKALVINSIITHHNSLRIGIGRQMVSAIKEIGRSHSVIDVIRVDTGDFMAYAHEFYRSCGFEEAAYVPHYLSWNNHQVIFVFQLKK
jgi:ribosomal protein S18 acetylase RimI-like enzyme